MPAYAPADHIVLATRNQGKIRELSSLLAPFKLTVLGLDAFPDAVDVEETGVTFAENALLKACTASKLTGLVAIADDSGLAVDALGGAPGVYSARYSEEPGKAATDASNVAKVLQELTGLAPEQRAARFCCCMAACSPSGKRLTAEGFWHGRLLEERRGENGFGYDPIFFDEEKGLTAAQMEAAEKNSRSHRAKAVANLLEQWPSFWREWLRDLADNA